MKEVLIGIVLAIGSYLLGSFSGSIALSRSMKGGDVRTHGSGNAGATNMARVYGWGAGFLTLAVDVCKTLAATLVGKWLLGDVGLAIGGIACMLGHCFPIWYHFKGGKGISAGAAIGLVIDWRVFVTILAVFLILAFLTKKVSLGSICAAAALAVSAILFRETAPKIVLAVFTAVLAIFQHRGNIQRLLAGTEPDFKAAKREQK